MKEHNKQPHFDIEEELINIKNGLFSFTVRVADGNIVDLVFLSYVTYEGAEELNFPCTN